MSRVFVSYSSQDRAFIDRLVQRLILLDVEVWYDKFEIKVGESILDKIDEGIDKSDWLVVALSKTSVSSRWVTHELNIALMKTMEKGAFVLPIIIEDGVKIPSKLADRRYADLAADFESGLTDLLSVIAPEKRMLSTLPPNYQAFWKVSSKVYANLFRNPNGAAEIRKAMREVDAFKNAFMMTDAIYEIYIDICITRKRQLFLDEFMAECKDMINAEERTPTEREQMILWMLSIAMGGDQSNSPG